jgi:hypothetical protein
VPSRKLRQMLARHAARFFGGGGSGVLLARIKWALQLKARPPTFRLLLRGSERVDDAGQRFLANLLRQGLGMQGVPLRLELRCVVWSQQGGGGGGGGGGPECMQRVRGRMPLLAARGAAPAGRRLSQRGLSCLPGVTPPPPRPGTTCGGGCLRPARRAAGAA